MFLLIGTLVWAYLSAILDDMSLTIMWERWEGTIEHTLMAPVPRVVHLIGMSAFGVMHAPSRTGLIMAVCAAVLRPRLSHALARGGGNHRRWERQPGRTRDLGRDPADAVPGTRRADVVHGPGPGPVGLRRLLQGGCAPRMVAGRSRLAPTTYLLRGIRASVINGVGVGGQVQTLVVLGLFGVVLIPASLAAFSGAERWAKKTGRLRDWDESPVAGGGFASQR